MTRAPSQAEDVTDARVAGARALAHLTHYRWALPVLAELARSRGAKFVTLSRRLGVGPASLKSALLRLAELELVMRNPGYGHPLRPEYILGPRGREAGAAPDGLDDWMQRRDITGVARKKWSLPVLLVVAAGYARFGEIRAALASATPRAITLALKDLAAAGLLTRRIDEGYPPTPRYRVTPAARAGVRHATRIGGLLAAALG